jgi:hypothetical protein
MANDLSRRLFLRGVLGAAVAAPFLGSVFERAAKAQGMPTPQAPKRLIVMFTHYGCLTNRWFPTKSHGPLTAADYTATNLAALAAFAPKILMPRGIRSMNQWHAKNSKQGTAVGQGNDPHTQVVGSYFTCQPVTPNTNNPFDINNTAAKFNALPTGPSLDHVIARQLSPDKSPLFMRVSGTQDNNQTGISFSDAQVSFPGVGKASQVYSTLTGLFKTGTVTTPADYQAIKGKSILDLVKGDLQTLERYDMSSSDKQKLAAWKELMSSTGTTVAQITQQCNANLAATLGLTDKALAGGAGGIGGDPVAGKITDTMDGADVFAALATLAAACNANPVIFLKFPGNYVFRGLTTPSGKAISLENHSASHRIGNANQGGDDCVDGVMDILDTIDKFYVSKFANLLKLLDSIPEGDRTVLDNSAAIWFQEMSDGNAHNLNNIPIIHAGSCGGYFKTGQAVNVDTANTGAANLTRGNSDKFCNGTNFIPTNEVDTTGTTEGTAVAPINKYFCNIMNALGVKAGADGFPKEGGTAPVTHYGMYDNTADFFGGGTNPAKINNPGEYTALKASS